MPWDHGYPRRVLPIALPRSKIDNLTDLQRNMFILKTVVHAGTEQMPAVQHPRGDWQWWKRGVLKHAAGPSSLIYQSVDVGLPLSSDHAVILRASTHFTVIEHNLTSSCDVVRTVSRCLAPP